MNIAFIVGKNEKLSRVIQQFYLDRHYKWPSNQNKILYVDKPILFIQDDSKCITYRSYRSLYNSYLCREQPDIAIDLR